ncbi:MAG TPA: FecR family protein [Perlabentimonas sp.]|jgi:ferric-dicitrate binding protein FerR (iron transport regulator)|nr:FecR family protein [Bacteroidales bacterium]MDD4672786.1 FecR family protein [Bacteroidales bacterium]MDY0347945.1 FecR family protein [Tenuifilaceae bacterium]HZJ74435.1 FecR family protein [Perlabentimonas sp.]
MNNSIDNIFKEKVSNLSSIPENTLWTPEKGWDEYQKMHSKRIKPFSKLVLLAASAAATVAIIVALSIGTNIFSPKTIIISSAADSIRELLLPNGSKVWMNKNSTIAYSTKKSGEFNLKLDGEIYVEITDEPKAPYTIKAGNAIITVKSPTKLNVRAYPNDTDIDITVRDGSVSVSDNILGQGLALLVTKGNYCSVSRINNFAFATANTNHNYLAWKTGKLIFNETPMATVTQVLRQYYGKEIIIADDTVAYYSYTGSFNKESFDNVLVLIQSDGNIEMSMDGNVVTFSKKTVIN